MSFLPTNVGAERKKLYWLIGLMCTAVVAYFISSSTTDSPGAGSGAGAVASKLAPADLTAIAAPIPAVRKDAPSIMPMKRTQPGAMARGEGQTGGDFKPTLKPKEGVDISAIDPTLHLDRLAKLHNLAMEGGARSLFKEGSAPVPPPDQVTIKPGAMAASNIPPAPVLPPKPDGPPPPPPPTPIPLKFYGFTSAARAGGTKQAFFLDGDDIHIAGENDVIRNRYKIIRIGVNSAVVEDTTDKHQQTLPLVEELAG